MSSVSARGRQSRANAAAAEYIRVPTPVMAADADMAPPSHYVEVFGLLAFLDCAD